MTTKAKTRQSISTPRKKMANNKSTPAKSPQTRKAPPPPPPPAPSGPTDEVAPVDPVQVELVTCLCEEDRLLVCAKRNKVSLYCLDTKQLVTSKSLSSPVLSLRSSSESSSNDVHAVTETSLFVLSLPGLDISKTLPLSPPLSHGHASLSESGAVKCMVSVDRGEKPIVRVQRKKGDVPHGEAAAYQGRALYCHNDEHLSLISLSNALIMMPGLEKGRKRFKNFPGSRRITCIASHPTEAVVALGDASGRIFVCSLTGEKDISHLQAHWHSLPVTALAWSPDGEYLYSGGGEAVLVKWKASDLTKDCLAPRLGGAIRNIVASHSQVVASMENFAVKCFNHRLEMSAHFSVSMEMEVHRREDGLFWHAPSASIAYKRSSGSINFYDPYAKKDILTMDITGRNVIRGRKAGERPGEAKDPEIIFDVSRDGKLMATAEERCAKVWRYDTNEFKLDVSLLNCHDEDITAIAVKEQGEGKAFCATISRGRDVKLWAKVDEQGWTLSKQIVYKSLNPKCVCFSSDATVMAVGYDGVLTLWSSDTVELRATLILKDSDMFEAPTSLTFGSGEQSQFLFCSSASSVKVWDVISLQLAVNINLSGCSLRRGSSKSVLVFSSGSAYTLSRDFALEKLFGDPETFDVLSDGCNVVFAVRKDGEVEQVDLSGRLVQTKAKQEWTRPAVATDSSLNLKKIDRAAVESVTDSTKWLWKEKKVERPLSRGLTSLLKQSL